MMFFDNDWSPYVTFDNVFTVTKLWQILPWLLHLQASSWTDSLLYDDCIEYLRPTMHISDESPQNSEQYSVSW